MRSNHRVGVLHIGSKRLLALQGTLPGLVRAPQVRVWLRLQCSIQGKQACALGSCTVLNPHPPYQMYENTAGCVQYLIR